MRSLALTPTWSVATVLTVFVVVSLIVERSIHRLSNVSSIGYLIHVFFLSFRLSVLSSVSHCQNQIHSGLTFFFFLICFTLWSSDLYFNPDVICFTFLGRYPSLEVLFKIWISFLLSFQLKRTFRSQLALWTKRGIHAL